MQAARRLITGELSRNGKDKCVGRAEALRQSMLALVDAPQVYQACPANWAPFVVVGEGGLARQPVRLMWPGIAEGWSANDDRAGLGRYCCKSHGGRSDAAMLRRHSKYHSRERHCQERDSSCAVNRKQESIRSQLIEFRSDF